MARGRASARSNGKNGPASAQSGIRIEGNHVHIVDLVIESREVANFLTARGPEEWPSVLTDAAEVGIYCLERATTAQDLEFVRRQLTDLIIDVEGAVGKIPSSLEKQLSAKLGTDDGQVLAPVRAMLGEVTSVSAARLEEVQKLLRDEIDPTRESTTLGRALRTLAELLDPKRSDSVQGVLRASLETVTGADGALAATVKATVSEAVSPLAKEVDRLVLEFRGTHAAAEALKATTLKGSDFESRTLLQLRPWARATGASIEHVGGDNRPGDLVIELVEPGSDSVTRIVVEARDRRTALGRKALTAAMERAMLERECSLGMYVSQSSAGLGAEVGEWAEGTCAPGCFVATTSEHALTALRFLLVQKHLMEMKAAQAELDQGSFLKQIERVRTSLARVVAINRRVTAIRTAASGVQDEAETLRDEVRDALAALEECARAQ